MLNSEAPAPKIELISFNLASTLIVVDTNALKDWVIPLITVVVAPKAKTRAVDASRDFWNSEAWPVILPKACCTCLAEALILAGFKFKLALILIGAGIAI